MKVDALRPIEIRLADVVFDDGEPGRAKGGDALTVVRWRGVVLGTQTTGGSLVPEVRAKLLHQSLVGALATPCPGDGYPIDALFEAKRGLPADAPTLTVAVCTAGIRPELESALQSLVDDTSVSEVLVVDNSAGPQSRVGDVVRRRCPGARVVRAPIVGLDRARNVALAEAKSDVVAFLDDDAVADCNWSAAVRAAFTEEPHLGVLTGLVLPLELETQAQLRFERYAGFGKGFDRRWWEEMVASRRADPSLRFRTWEIGTGANMAVRRSLLLELGGFDSALDAGTPALGCGDLEMIFRVAKRRWSIRYEPGALAWHRHRRDMKGLRSQVRGFGGFAAMFLATARADPRELRSIPALVRWYRSYFGWRLRSSPRTDHELFAHELLGYLSVTTAGMWLAVVRAGIVGDLARTRWQPSDGPGRHTGGVARFSIDLGEPQPLYFDVAGCGTTRWTIRASHRDLGTFDMQSDGDNISFARLRESIAAHFGLRLVSASDRNTVQRRLAGTRLQLRRASPSSPGISGGAT